MSGSIQLIAGLGNPGRRYADTRHNVGYWFADALAREHGGSFRTSRFEAQLCELSIAGGRRRLLKPETYMNHSGRSVAAAARYFAIPSAELLVVHDELDLPIGVVRLKLGGGFGSHNGVKDIAQALGASDFARLRIGIGHPGAGADVTAYVLGRPPASEREQLHAALERALEQLPDIVRGEFQQVMNALHSPAERAADGADGSGAA